MTCEEVGAMKSLLTVLEGAWKGRLLMAKLVTSVTAISSVCLEDSALKLKMRTAGAQLE
jgi:hypothetical protein